MRRYLVLFLVASSPLLADVIELTNGGTVIGKVVSETKTEYTVVMKIGGLVETFDRTKIKSIKETSDPVLTLWVEKYEIDKAIKSKPDTAPFIEYGKRYAELGKKFEAMPELKSRALDIYKIAESYGFKVLNKPQPPEKTPATVEVKKQCPLCSGQKKIGCFCCGGNAKRSCPMCHDGVIRYEGEGPNKRKILCGYCQHRGYIVCQICKNAGKIICPLCSGSGEVAETAEPCNECHGTGLSHCPNSAAGLEKNDGKPKESIGLCIFGRCSCQLCRGAGCNTCGGKGWVSCPTCGKYKHLGMVPCSTCGGQRIKTATE